MRSAQAVQIISIMININTKFVRIRILTAAGSERIKLRRRAHAQTARL